MKKMMISALASALVVSGMILPHTSTIAYAKMQKVASPNESNTIVFHDANIKAMVKIELALILHHQITDADLTQENLNKITSLFTLDGSNLTTLADLVHLPNLTSLTLMASTGAKTFDTKPLATLSKLKNFTFWYPDGQLSSLTSLENKPLTNLVIHAQPTTDNSENILNTLSKLEKTDITYTTSKQLDNIGSLNNLPDLKEITLIDLGLKEAPSLAASKNLTDVIFDENEISTVPDLSNCKKLEILSLSYNQIKDYTNVDKLIDLPSMPFIDLSYNLLTTYPEVAKKLKSASLNFNFIDGHGLDSQYAIRHIDTQNLQQGESKSIPITWVDEKTNTPPIEGFTTQQKEFIDTKNAKFSTDNANLTIKPDGTNIVIKAANGVSGETHVTMTYSGDLKTSFDVNVK